MFFSVLERGKMRIDSFCRKQLKKAEKSGLLARNARIDSGHKSAVYAKRLAGDESRVIGREEIRGPGDVLRRAEA